MKQLAALLVVLAATVAVADPPNQIDTEYQVPVRAYSCVAPYLPLSKAFAESSWGYVWENPKLFTADGENVRYNSTSLLIDGSDVCGDDNVVTERLFVYNSSAYNGPYSDYEPGTSTPSSNLGYLLFAWDGSDLTRICKGGTGLTTSCSAPFVWPSVARLRTRVEAERTGDDVYVDGIQQNLDVDTELWVYHMIVYSEDEYDYWCNESRQGCCDGDCNNFSGF